MGFLKRHPFIFAILTGLLVLVMCTAVGFGVSVYVGKSISERVKATNPNDPLDGLLIIVFGILLSGAVLGALGGIILGLVVYLKYSD